MLDALIVLVATATCGALGLPLARLLPANAFPWRLLAAPTLGLSVLAVFVTVAYRYGLSPGWALAAAAAAGAGLSAYALRTWVERRRAGATEGPATGLAAGVALAWLAVQGLLLLPRWVGGDQFAVFQGNQWDTFGYLSSAVVFAGTPYREVAAAGQAEFLANPLLGVASGNLEARPAVHLLYSTFSQVAPGEAHHLHYAFLAFLLCQAFLVAALLLRSWSPPARTAAILAVAPAFALGFWGQYVFDINAWSQLAALPGLLLLAGVLVDLAAAPWPGPALPAAPTAAAIAVLTAGATYLYPECLAYQLATLLPLTATALGWRAWRSRPRSAAPLLPLAGLAGAAAGVLYWRGTLGFLLGQLGAGSGPPVPWWRFFQAFFFGRDALPAGESPLSAAVDFGAGLLGLYFATPAPDTSPGLALAWRVGLLAVMAALVASCASALAGPRAAPATPGRDRLRLAALAWGLSLLPAAVLAARGHFWPAGKAVSWGAPLLVLLLSTPAVAAGQAGRRWAAAGVAWAFVAAQLAFGLVRVGAAAGPTGIAYEPPYPSVQEPPLKEQLRWDLTPLERPLAGARRVLLAPMDPFMAHWLMTWLQARGRPFTMLGPIVRNFGAGEPLGSVAPPADADALVRSLPDGFEVQYADGRPAVRVAGGGAPR